MATLDERLSNLITGYNQIAHQLGVGQIVTDPLVASHVLPMLGDLVGCVQLLHELTNDMSDELAEPVQVLVGVVEQIIKAEILPMQWQGLLLFSLQPTLEALGEVDDVEDFTRRFQPQISKLEAWKETQAKEQQSPALPG